MKTKIKKPALSTITQEEAAGAAASYTNCQHVIDKKQAAMVAELAKVVARVENKYLPVINKSKELQTEASHVLKAYADQERSNWKGKSNVVGTVTLSFRTGATAVQLAKKETAESVINKLKEAGLKRFLRVKYELNKPAMLEETKPSVLNQLAECGVGFGNSETFYIEVG